MCVVNWILMISNFSAFFLLSHTHHFPSGDNCSKGWGMSILFACLFSSVVWQIALFFPLFSLNTNWKAGASSMKILALTLISEASKKAFLPPSYRFLFSNAGQVSRQGKEWRLMSQKRAKLNQFPDDRSHCLGLSLVPFLSARKAVTL